MKAFKLLAISFAFLFNAYTSFASDYYWVGGSGDWNTLSHWATTSGGATNHVSLPTLSDDVFFDANSFSGAGQTVTLTSSDKYCRNMSWSGVTNDPTFSIGSAKMHVYGSLTLNANMTLTNTLTPSAGFYFDASTAGQTIQTFGKTLYYDVFFRGTGTASWTLQDELRVFSRINFQGGTLNTNNQNITMMSSQGEIRFSTGFPSSFTGAPIVANLGSSTITASYIGAALTVLNVTINAGTSTLAVTTFSGADHNYYNVEFNGSGSTGFTGELPDQTGSYNNLDVNSGTQFTLQGSRTINGRLKFGVAGMTYLIQSGSTTTINGTFEIPSAACGALSALRSTSGGSQATISKASGTVTGARLNIKDIVATGGAIYNANNSIDEGNNSGWIFTTSAAQNFYWIGGSGDWNDGTQWSNTSGGSAANCTPSLNDDVFFDANSFNGAGQTITLTSGDKYCRNMSWAGVTNNPTLSIGSGKMHLYGSLTLNANMTLTNTLAVNAGFYFDASTAGQTIQTFGKTLYYDVFFRGTGTASWTLQDELKVFDRINFQGGTLNTNNQNITMMSSQGEVRFSTGFPSSFTGAPVVANLGSSTITASYIGAALTVLNVTINAGTSTLAVTTFSGADHNYYNVEFNGSGSTGFTGELPDQTGSYNNLDVNSGTQFTLQGSRTINGRLKFGVAGMTYLIQSGSTTTINGTFEIPSAACGALSALRSTSGGSQATISKASGTVTGARLNIKDIVATGGAIYNANNSIDEGNNSGWIFTTSAAQNFYWIGGSGDWNDGTQWSNTSGGSAANCTPSLNDDVFFDANSFNGAGQTITLTSGDKYCRNMSWAGVTNNPTLSIGSGKMHLYGSLTLNANMTLTNTLTPDAGFYFDASTAGQTIQTFGKTLYYDVFFRGTGTASWTLQDELRVFSRINFQGGTLNTNDQNITMMSSQGEIRFSTGFPSSFTGAPIVANLGSSTITASYIGSALAVLNVTINAGTSTLAVTTFSGADHNYYNVEFNGIGNVGFTGELFTNPGTYNNIDVNSGIDFTLQGSRTINGRLRFAVPGLNVSIQAGSTTTFNGTLESLGTLAQRVNIFSSSTGVIYIFQKTSGKLCTEFITLRDNTAITGAATYYASNSLDLGNNTGWNFTSLSCSDVLPVTLLKFETVCKSDGILFRWTTASEHNTSHFNVEKQIGNSWQIVGRINAAGESIVERNYEFLLNNQAKGNYRLVMVDKDGSFDYSLIRMVKCESPSSIRIIPNPAYNNTMIYVERSSPANVEIKLMNATGQLSHLQQRKLIQGTNQVTIDLKNLPAGLYIIQISSDEMNEKRSLIKLK